MGRDIDGYGFEDGDRSIDRLIEDLRILSPSGIERVGEVWEREAEGDGREPFVDAERAALHAIEQARLGSLWDSARSRVTQLTEQGPGALVNWRAEHPEGAHRAERAALAAILGLLAAGRVESVALETLVRPMAEALPWLTEATSGPRPGRPG